MGRWIEQRIRVTAKRTFCAWLLTLGLVGSAYVACARYWLDFASGASALSEADLDGIGAPDAAPHQWVRVTGTRALDTGVRELEVREKDGRKSEETVLASYYALEIGDRFLIVKSDHGLPTTADGELLSLPGDFARTFFEDPELGARRAEFYPFYLNTSSFRGPGYLALVATAALLGAFGVFGLRALRRWRDPSAHPAARRAGSWGDPMTVDVAVEREQQSPRLSAGGWRLGDGYLVRSSFFRFDVLRFEDLLWGYKTITRHSVNFIPTGKSFKATLVCVGGNAEIGGRQKTVDAVLEFAAGRAPWAVFGYSKERETLLRKDSAAFVQAVAERKRELSRPGGAPPA